MFNSQFQFYKIRIMEMDGCDVRSQIVLLQGFLIYIYKYVCNLLCSLFKKKFKMCFMQNSMIKSRWWTIEQMNLRNM